MKIVQLSDIHLSSSNSEKLTDFYLNALIKDLNNFQPIDLLLITGDLVDKGGSSLGTNPYKVFEDSFLIPILKGLKMEKNSVLFIPGNHDIDRNLIEEDNEFWLSHALNTEKANKVLKEQFKEFTRSNKRIEKFKLFEKDYHKDNPNYNFSNNESLVIIDSKEGKIGFALINDSWRCSPSLKKDQHFIGINQLYNASNYFQTQDTLLNIAVFHHPLEMLNENEKEEIDNILKSKQFNIAFFGHTHKNKYESISSHYGGIKLINGRSAFNEINERDYSYQPGYNILDLNIKSKSGFVA